MDVFWDTVYSTYLYEFVLDMVFFICDVIQH